MTVVKIPDADNVVHYLSSLKHDNGVVIEPAFQRRKPGEDVSVNWLEHFSGLSKEEQLAEVRRLTRLTIKKSGRFAELNVGDVKQHLHAQCSTLDFISTPLGVTEKFAADPSHGDIIGLPPYESPHARLVGDMIAECVSTLHPGVREV